MNHRLQPLADVSSRLGSIASGLVLIMSASALAAGCGSATPAASAPRTAAPSSGGSPSSSPPQEVLAVVEGEEVTLADLQDEIGVQLGQMDFEYFSRRHQIIDGAMRRHVRERLLEAEADDRGVSVEALLDEVLAGKVDVSEDEVRFFYAQNQAALQGRPYDAIAPQIRDYLESQVRDSVLEEFTAGIVEDREVAYLLEPFRVDIDIAGAPVTGPDDAVITLVEFSDFECPYCQSFNPTLERVKREYADEVKVVFLQFPLREIHPNAQKAAEAALCAFEQGKFWEAHDLYFAEQDSLDIAGLKEKAERLELDIERFNTCFDNETYVDRVDADVSLGVGVGVAGTPAVFINGRPLPGGAVPFEMVAELIDDELERIGR
jgi:predicted DsbA family dithiol-disulfide isomerase